MFKNLFNQTSKYTLTNTINFIPPVSKGTVIKVYDGDTITIGTTLTFKETLFKSNKQKYKFNVRLAHIDCAELRTSDSNEKKAALFAKYKLEDLILYKKIKLDNVKLDKYGRLLADVICNGVNINKWMLEQKLAVEYEGKKKETIDWFNYIGVEKIQMDEFIKAHEEKKEIDNGN